MNINEYKTADQKFEDQIKSLIDNGEITQEMADHLKYHRNLRKDFKESEVSAEMILNSLRRGILI